ncbi:MAG TPA: carbohydrate ABC transporter permease [Candidatus Limnocylindrales bacterium]|nr:carbohydrate ABC transporter permease [Candidatus Limnocylindrales bacterium]
MVGPADATPAGAVQATHPRFLGLVRRRRGDTRRRPAADRGKSFAMTFLAVVVVALFLSPLVRSLTLSIKSPQQVAAVDAPLWPSSPLTFTYRDRDYPIYNVSLPGGTTKQLALVKKGLHQSSFADPSDPNVQTAPLIKWDGSWRDLTGVQVLDPHFENYANVWNEINYPRLLFNTIAIALIGMIGTVVSCTLVAYGFARFRFRGRNALFLLVIATIFLPAAVTTIPTYTLFLKIGWVGTWLPLLVPTFFANAYDVFLLRQYLLTIPREMDEAAVIDGAGPFRTLISVIIPQAWPVIIAVAIFHLVYSWNDFFGPLIYLSGSPDLQTVAVGLASFSGARVALDPGLIQAATLMTLVIPVLLFLVFQRVFVRGVVITGVER